MPPVLFAIAAVVSTGVSLYEQSKAAGAAQDANKFQRQQADLQAARQRRDAIRQARITYANAQQTAENQGAASTSSAQGGQASIISQLNSNLSFLDQFNHLSDLASISLGKAAKYQANAQAAETIGNTAASAYANPTGVTKFVKSIFG